MDSDSNNLRSNRFSGNHYTNFNNNNNEKINTPKRNPKNNQSPHPKWRLIYLILGIIAIFSIMIIHHKWNNAKQAASKTYLSANVNKKRNVHQLIAQGKPVSILLLGTDTGALGRNYRGRTDTMIVVTLNPKKQKMTMTSVPRDLALSIPGHSEEAPSKINSAYDFDQAKGSIKSVEKVLNIPIDYYGLVNMGGMEQIVDGVGGVTVNPPLTFKYGNADVKKGQKIHLNGKQALDYSRMRYDDPKGDYGRQIRQRQIIAACVSKGDSATALFDTKLMNSVQNQIKTDLTFRDLINLSTNYRLATHHLKSDHVQGQSQMINGQSFEVASTNERQRITNFIRNELEIPKATTGSTGLEDITTGDLGLESNTNSYTGTNYYGTNNNSSYASNSYQTRSIY